MRRLVIALACLGGAAVAGVLSARPVAALDEGRPGSNRAVAELPPYPDTLFFAMGGSVHVDGKPREMAYAVTADAPDKVSAHYAAVWTSQGLQVDERRIGDERWVSAQRDGELLTIAAMPQGQGSVIVGSVSNVFAQPARHLASLPPSCRALGRTGARDGTVDSELVFASCDNTTLTEVRAYYEQQLADAELAELDQTLHWRGPAREVTLEPAVDEKNARVAFTLSWQERAPR
jgi:hypothetical protein